MNGNEKPQMQLIDAQPNFLWQFATWVFLCERTFAQKGAAIKCASNVSGWCIDMWQIEKKKIPP